MPNVPKSQRADWTVTAALGIAPPNAPRTTRCVNTTGAGGCMTSIQAAINASNPGDIILVDSGVYTEHISIGKNISIYGQGVFSTTINGNSSAPQATVYVFSGDVTASTVISGVHITGGGTGSTSANGSGIVIASASPTIINTWVDGNTGHDGGGVSVLNGSPSFTNVAATNNRAYQGGGFYLAQGGTITILGNPLDVLSGAIWWNVAENGGGIYTSGVTVTLGGLHIVGNIANNCGGGIYSNNASNLLVGANWIQSNAANCGGGAFFQQSAGLFQSNWVIGNAVDGMGGGVAHIGPGGLTFAGNWFERNQASNGAGAAFWSDAAPIVDANVFVTNTAFFGGAMYLAQSDILTVTNNIMARNVVTNSGYIAGGVQVYQAPARLINNTIADNAGEGIFFDRANGIVIVNNIISGHPGDSIAMSPYDHTTVYTIDYDDRYSNGGTHEAPVGARDVSVDPLFRAAGADLKEYYHIQATSPISRTGSLTWAPPKDIDGESRLLCGVSMGRRPNSVPRVVSKPAVCAQVSRGRLVTAR